MRLVSFSLICTFVFGNAACSVDGLQEVKIPDCEDGNPCTAGDYTERTNECFFIPVEDGTECPAANACVLSAICEEGVCISQEFVTCDDENPCTGDICNEDSGECSNPEVSDDTVCPNATACFVNAICVSGECTPGDPVICDDSNPCTVGTCLDDSGECDYENLPDGTPCGEDLICEEGACIPIDFPPSTPLVQIQPENPVDSSELTCAIIGESVDPNGDVITYSYKWLINGLISTEHTGSQISAEDTNACDSFT